MSRNKIVFLILSILGTIIPWLFFIEFFGPEGGTFELFIQSLSINGAIGGVAADVAISALVFWLWSFMDARKIGHKRWWLVPAATLMVGLSLAMPLYFLLRPEE